LLDGNFLCVGLGVKLKQLEGVAIVDEDASPPVIWHFPEHQLPLSPAERLAALFDAKSKWTYQEILPYVKNVASTLPAVGHLLNKFSRVFTVNGVKFYSSKHNR